MSDHGGDSQEAIIATLRAALGKTEGDTIARLPDYQLIGERFDTACGLGYTKMLGTKAWCVVKLGKSHTTCYHCRKIHLKRSKIPAALERYRARNDGWVPAHGNGPEMVLDLIKEFEAFERGEDDKPAKKRPRNLTNKQLQELLRKWKGRYLKLRPEHIALADAAGRDAAILNEIDAEIAKEEAAATEEPVTPLSSTPLTAAEKSYEARRAEDATADRAMQKAEGWSLDDPLPPEAEVRALIPAAEKSPAPATPPDDPDEDADAVQEAAETAERRQGGNGIAGVKSALPDAAAPKAKSVILYGLRKATGIESDVPRRRAFNSPEAVAWQVVIRTGNGLSSKSFRKLSTALKFGREQAGADLGFVKSSNGHGEHVFSDEEVAVLFPPPPVDPVDAQIAQIIQRRPRSEPFSALLNTVAALSSPPAKTKTPAKAPIRTILGAVLGEAKAAAISAKTPGTGTRRTPAKASADTIPQGHRIVRRISTAKRAKGSKP